MRVIKFVLRLLGWFLTIALQIAASFAVIFLFSVVFSNVNTTSRLGWLALLFFIWLGYVVGVNLVGLGFLRWVWKDFRLLPAQRLIGTMIGALIPLLILLPIGFSIPAWPGGTQFSEIVTNTWQPILAQVSLFVSILGYYAPGMILQKPMKPV
jgi:hypothetical protein